MSNIYIVYVFCGLITAAIVVSRILKVSEKRWLRKMSGKVLKGPPQYAKHYSESSLKDLPVPVQHYFKAVLREGQAFPRTASVKHIGEIKAGPRKKWTHVRGTEFFSTRYLAFFWHGKTAWLTATDSLLNGKGKLKIKLLSIFRVAQYSGKNVDRSELLRWISEAVWFPTALLPDKNLRWVAIDDSSALLEYYWEDSKLSLNVYFTPDYKISGLETQRHDTEGQLKTWIGKVSRYQRHGGMMIPSIMEARWKHEPEAYARFQLTYIKYDLQ